MILEVLALLAVGAYTRAAFRQLGVMNKQLVEMKGSGVQTNELICLYGQQLAQLTKQAVDTHELAAQAKKQAAQTEHLASNALVQANASKDLATNARRSFDASLRSERAWIGIQHLHFNSFSDSQHVKLGFDMINTGRTPALSVRLGTVGFEFLPNPMEISQLKTYVAVRFGYLKQALRPMAPISPQGSENTLEIDPDTLPTGAVAAIQGGTMLYIILGRVEYTDVSDKPEWLNFCIEVTKIIDNQPGWVDCPVGNDMSYETER